jgi:putative ABC transport system substrate-binding protein
MDRRAFVSGIGFAAASLPLCAHAQTSNRMYRLAHLANSAASEAYTRQITLPELARLGFVEGRNLVFEGRVGQPDALPGLVAELLANKPDAILTVGPALIAAGAATKTVPIVSFGFDPIALGLAANYARPGGNVTGVVILVGEMEAKRLSILHEAVPDRRRVAALVPPNGRGGNEAALRKAAAGLGVELLAFPAGAPGDYQAAFAAMKAQGAQALLIGATPEFDRDAKQLADLALDARLPTICEWSDMAHKGCMIGYGPGRIALRKRLADLVAQIFRGVPAGEIAIETPTVFEFALNAGVAKALDINVPFAIRASADEVID